MSKIHEINSYIDELSSDLSILEDNEVQDVVEFYSEYLLDSNLETRADFEAELGSPKRLARKVLADYSISSSYLDEQDEANFIDKKIKSNETSSDNPFRLSNVVIITAAFCIVVSIIMTILLGPDGFFLSIPLAMIVAVIGISVHLVLGKDNGGEDSTGFESSESKRFSDAKTIWLIILGLLAIPIGIPVAIALLAIIAAAIVAILALMFSFLLLVVALFAGGSFIIFTALKVVGTDLAVTTFYSGIGLILIVFSLMLAPAVYQLAKILFEAVVKFVKYIGQRFFRKQYYKKSSEEV